MTSQNLNIEITGVKYRSDFKASYYYYCAPVATEEEQG